MCFGSKNGSIGHINASNSCAELSNWFSKQATATAHAVPAPVPAGPELWNPISVPPSEEALLVAASPSARKADVRVGGSVRIGAWDGIETRVPLPAPPPPRPPSVQLLQWKKTKVIGGEVYCDSS